MKYVLFLLIGMPLLTGCMHRYDITLVNGMRVTRVSKPKLDRATGRYVYKDMKGEEKSISASRVVEIAPHGKE